MVEDNTNIYGESPEEELKRISDLAEKLLERHDSVFVLCTRYDSDSKRTRVVHFNDGNTHATRGAIEEWLLVEKEKAKLAVRKEEKKPENL